ncbi:acyl-CoA N-acyltransferase [Amylocarpus encephaloides]|uniref:Acyl-CoA N-acyltransferase n=1 Tax=Amylocarpus encephaloides TaxID=45428 RepID=A0A9P7YRX4_9HELO|nr:acyl-CoA N-acyltransferase [Amylocarpus encephaloides]
MASQPPPQFLISEILPADIPSMIPVYNSAFKDDYLTNFTLPRAAITDTEWTRWLSHRISLSLKKPNCRNYKIFDTSTGEMAGHCRLQIPYVFSDEERREMEERDKREEEQAKREGRHKIWPTGSNLEVVELKFGALDEMKKKYVDEGEDYICQLLAIDRLYQRKGLGSMLLKHVLDMADAEGRKVYIEATDAGWPLYKKLGFEDIDIIEIDVSKWGGDRIGTNKIMMRQPKKS